MTKATTKLHMKYYSTFSAEIMAKIPHTENITLK